MLNGLGTRRGGPTGSSPLRAPRYRTGVTDSELVAEAPAASVTVT
jgi:hypothetical protein